MSDPTRETVLAALAAIGKPMKIQHIAARLDYYTNEPWAIVTLCQGLEQEGLVAWDRKRSPHRVTLTTAGRAALDGSR